MQLKEHTRPRPVAPQEVPRARTGMPAVHRGPDHTRQVTLRHPGAVGLSSATVAAAPTVSVGPTGVPAAPVL